MYYLFRSFCQRVYNRRRICRFIQFVSDSRRLHIDKIQQQQQQKKDSSLY